MSQEQLINNLAHLQRDTNAITFSSMMLSKNLGQLITVLTEDEFNEAEFSEKFFKFSVALTTLTNSLEAFERSASKIGGKNEE